QQAVRGRAAQPVDVDVADGGRLSVERRAGQGRGSEDSGHTAVDARDGRPGAERGSGLIHLPGFPSSRSGTIAPAIAPTTRAILPAPRTEASSPASDPIPAPTTASMMRLAIAYCLPGSPMM